MLSVICRNIFHVFQILFRYNLKYYFCRFTRFKWTQVATLDATPSHKWALSNVYIGPQCTHHCHGHGSCLSSVCVCDKGYYGESCARSIDNPVNIFFDIL